MSTLMLRRLTAASNRMLKNLIQLSNNDETFAKLKEDLEQLRRRSHIMSLVYDKNVISVAGLQGVGKSTFVSNLYGYDSTNTPFLENQGQGETIPILVSESEHPGKFFVHKVIENNGILEINKVEISGREEFHRISHEYKSDDLLLEVTVPFKVLNDSIRSFLLLPGFQHETDYLKDLTFSALRSSSNCIVLFYQPKFAHKSNLELINTLTQEFSEACPIFVITWSDNENSNVEFQKDVKAKLNIEEDDRVIRAGIPGPEGWRDSIIKAIQTYGLPSGQMHFIQKKNIKQLTTDYNKLIAGIQNEIGIFNRDKSNEEYHQVDRIIKVIQGQKYAIRNTLKDYLEESYTAYFGRIQDNISNKIADTYKDLGGYIKTIKEWFQNNVQTRIDFEKLVNDCIKESNKNSVQGEYHLVLNRIINKYLSEHKLVMHLPDQANVSCDEKSLLCGDKAELKEISSTLLNDIYLIFNHEDKTKEFSDEFLFNIKILPLLAIEGFRINSIITENKYGNNSLGSIEEKKSLIDLYVANKGEVAIGVGLLFGLDIMEGNGIDLFGLLKHNAISGGSAMAAASFHWALATISAVAMVVFMFDQLNKSVDKKDSLARVAIENMKNYTIENILLKYDANMLRVEEIVGECLMRRYGLAAQFAHIQNCYQTIEDLNRIKTEIEKANMAESWMA